MSEFECQANAAETGQGSSATPLQFGVSAEAWQPIETAPETAKSILIYRAGDTEPHIVRSDVGWWRICHKFGARPPKGWMPLPSLPQELRQIEEPSGDEALLSNGGQPDTNKSEIVP